MTAIQVNQPNYGPNGETIRLRIRTEHGIQTEWHWTEAEAMNRRDQALDNGAISVAISGIPFRGMVNG